MSKKGRKKAEKRTAKNALKVPRSKAASNVNPIVKNVLQENDNGQDVIEEKLNKTSSKANKISKPSGESPEFLGKLKEKLVLSEELYHKITVMSGEAGSILNKLKKKDDNINKEYEVELGRCKEAIALLKENTTKLEADLENIQDDANKRIIQLDKLKKQVDEKEAELVKESRIITADKLILNEDKASVVETAERLNAGKIERLEESVQALNERLEAAREINRELEKKYSEKENIERRIGDNSPEEMITQIHELRQENEKLATAIGERPGPDAFRELKDLSKQKEQWETDRNDIATEVSKLKQELNQARIAVIELESLRDHKAALEASNELLKHYHEKTIKEVKDLVQGEYGASPFPTCVRMDVEDDLQSADALTEEIYDLPKFVDFIQHKIASGVYGERALYFAAEDIRSLLGGLAMSRLHLFQGISGTGKTSLPLAFAKAIGAGSSLIEVQAGWRDKQDLIGHYNAFERRYYESEFLLALYEAGCPKYKNKPYIVVLDEMNLSHPEHYFADLLSALEQASENQNLALMTASVEKPPTLMIEGGRKLPLPQNVWFMGTANHDETTKDFADKTYDRSHVMELPRRHRVFITKQKKNEHPFAVQALMDAFIRAKDENIKAAQTTYKFLEKRFGDYLGKHFRIGWGNRLQRQMEDYVSVIIAAGGSEGEALDHILATKLLRKIRGRHDNRIEDVLTLRDQISMSWDDLDKDSVPLKSFDLLKDELHRLGHEEE